MAPERWQPDMVIGIDFGMTSTAVAWSMGPEWPEPKTLQHWPGKLGHELRNKVNTCVTYHVDTGNLASWGFLCNPDDPKFEYNELFKLWLDPNYAETNPSSEAPTLVEARTWFRDYLSCLHKCIVRYFDQSMARFQQKKVEYVFSVPTTWKDPAMIAETEKCIRDAGFGQHASVYLTEAEAAAVYACKLSLEVGDVLLVCDIGGGTTDLNVLKVKSVASSNMELVPLSWTEGMAVGSTLIDFKIQQIIHERLERVRTPLAIPGDMDALATQMIHETFLPFKCAFGNESFAATDLFLPIPGLPAGKCSEDAGIRDSKMILKLDVVRAVFEEQVSRLFTMIDQQLQVVQSRYPQESIPYLVLSGGLGSSPYVQERIKTRYTRGTGVSFKVAKSMKVLVAGEPQLAVVHGLVIARSQTCKSGKEVLTKRCSPASYGIVCREVYDPSKHQGQNIVLDDNDKREWATDQIAWLVKRGDVFDANKGASQMYQIKLAIGEERLPWKVKVAMSTEPVDGIPQSIRDKRARVVCEIEFALDAKDFKVKNKHWYQTKKPYMTGDFEVRLLVGTGLRFEIWNKNKDTVLSKAHDEIQVEWVPIGTLTTPTTDGSRMYRVKETS